jgi:2-dehydro-3-deoxyphosphooctonate aldolase (KDO 8-P synthase)
LETLNPPRRKPKVQTVKVGAALVGPDEPLTLIAGPCVIESLDQSLLTAERLCQIAQKLKINLIFKSSFDKANRTSLDSFRGVGFHQGLEILAKVKKNLGVSLISDVHETWQIREAAEVLDCLQIPAFLARQTDLLLAAADSSRPVNVKKGQFMAPQDMGLAAQKMSSRLNFKGLLMCERGASFGYHNLVVDMRSLVIMREHGWPIVFDATHSVQLPSAGLNCSSGERRFVPALCRAALAIGVEALFLETHPEPERALCDGPNQWPLDRLEALLESLLPFHSLSRIEDELGFF